MREPVSTLRTLDLPGGGLVPFASIPGGRVRVLYGRVWLTEEGDTRDAFLASGEEAGLAGRGLAVIEALGPARIELIEEVRGPSLLARAAAALAGRAKSLLRRLTLQQRYPVRGAV